MWSGLGFGKSPRSLVSSSTTDELTGVLDRDSELRTSNSNPWVKRLSEEFLGEPLGHKSHELPHTTYDKREVIW